MSNLNNGLLSCDICSKKYVLSDPNIFSYENDKDICKKCFHEVAKNTSWNSVIKKRVLFNYIKVNIPWSLKYKVFERDKYICKFCGSTENLTIDHIYPESLGGTLDLDNLQTLCRSCNSSKKDKVYE